MRLVTIAAPPGGRTGIIVGEDVLDFALAASVLPLAGWVPQAMQTLFAAGAEGLDLIRRLMDRVASGRDDNIAARLRASGALRPLASTELLAPVPRPGIVLSHGRAYKSHLKEMNSKGEDEPHGFMKNVNAIIGPGAPIILPPQCADMVDLEGEFSVVFGAPCHNVTQSQAMDFVIGYTLINDVSARNWVAQFQQTRDPDQNRMGKQLPTFCPMGPAIATKDEIPDPDDVRMVTTLNGQVMQDFEHVGPHLEHPAAHRLLFALVPLHAGRHPDDRLAVRRRLCPQSQDLHEARRRGDGDGRLHRHLVEPGARRHRKLRRPPLPRLTLPRAALAACLLAALLALPARAADPIKSASASR